VAFAWWRELGTLWDRRREGRFVVQRVGCEPNTLVRFDPKTEKFQTWEIPSGGGVVRNMMATQDGNLVLACSGVDRIALVDVQ
jgi:streptogramin lyase